MNRSENRRRGFKWAVLSSAAAAAMLASGTAFAQSNEDGVAPADGAAADIVVTGSRIQRTGIDAPTPTVAVTAEDIEASGITNVVDILNELPQISTGFSNANTSFSFGNIGLNQVDLRNLGVRRTLTLVDGRRRAGTPDDSNFLAFDLSSIPPSRSPSITPRGPASIGRKVCSAESKMTSVHSPFAPNGR